MTLYDEPIFIFSIKRISTKGYINMHITFGEGDLMKMILIQYLVINANMSYKNLMG